MFENEFNKRRNRLEPQAQALINKNGYEPYT